MRIPADFAVQQYPTDLIDKQPRELLVRSLRILVVDENIDAVETLALLLRLKGHDVQLAYDGEAALKVAKAYRPEVVVLYIGLPKLDGYEVARRLRTQSTSQPYLIAFSGYGQEEDRDRSRQAGFDLHLVKPVEFGTLENLIASRPNETDCTQSKIDN